MTTNHGEEFALTGPAHKMPYEPDKFDSKPILAVPIVVIITGIIGFAITSILFANVFGPDPLEPAQNQMAAERNSAPLNDRMERISSTDPNATVKQPRLEGFRLSTENATVTSGTEIKPSKNSRYVTPWELLPQNYKSDRSATQPDLMTFQPLEGGKYKLPIDKVLELLANTNKIEAAAGAATIDVHAPVDRAKESNAGHRITEVLKAADLSKPAPVPPAPKKQPVPEPNNKGNEPKKEG
ncbi:MAG: hypothetical protein R3B84_24740 [Zavarzinella sp.]